MEKDRIVFITGAGISAPSGVPTFRSDDGLWKQYDIERTSTSKALQADKKYVIDFWNMIREQMFKASPNEAHLAITKLQDIYDVVVITQNVDDLHERAGNTNVIHLHGNINYARTVLTEDDEWYNDPEQVFVGQAPISYDLRPDIVLFGEEIDNYDRAKDIIQSIDTVKVVVIGTSLDVYPASKLVKCAHFNTEKHVIDLNPKHIYGYSRHAGSADIILPRLVDEWTKNGGC